MKKIISIILVGVLIYFLFNIDLGRAISLFSSASIVLLIVSLLIFTSNYLLKSIRLIMISRYYGAGLSLKDSFVTQVLSITLASFTPGRVGEFAKIYFLKRYGIKGAKPIGIVVFERLFDFAIISIIAVLFFMIYARMAHMVLVVAIFLGLVATGLVILFNAQRFLSFFPKVVQRYAAELKIVPSDPVFYLLILFTFLIWLIDGVGFFAVIRAFGHPIQFFPVLGIYCSMVVLSILSILPGGLGALDVSVFILFGWLGLSNESSLAILLVLRVITFVLPLFLSLSLMPWVDVNLLKLRKRIKT